MADQNHRAPGTRHIPHFAQALFLKLEITHGEHFIYKQNFWLEVCGHGKSQANIHAARIVLYRGINEVFKFRKTDNFVKFASYFLLAHTQNRTTKISVFSPGKFWMEPSANFQQAANTTTNFRPALRRPGYAGKNLQKCRLARAVPSNQAHDFALAHPKGHIL